MIRIAIGVLLTALALGAIGCGDEVLSLSEGTATTLSVRVWVDADGDGAFDAAVDVAVSGATVTVSPAAAGAETTQETGADGLATFEVAPGNYTLSVTGAAPAGAVLATAANPVVVAPFQGGTIESQFRYSFFPGSLSLVVFRDENANGTYESGTDTPAGGVGAVLTTGSDTVASGGTASDGTLVLPGLRPGDYSLTLAPLPTIQIANLTQTVTIGASGQTDLAVEFTGNLVVSVADARNAADGDLVAIEGVLTWQAQFRTTLDAFMQDGTAGMTLFDFNVDLDTLPVAIGDSIRVIGRKGAFAGEIQIDSVGVLEVLGAVGEPAPAVVTAADINSGNFGSQLVTIDATVDSVFADGFDNATVWLSDAVGDDFKVRSDSRTGTVSADWVVDQLYSVTGVVGTSTFDAVPHRIETRGTGDVVAGGSAITVAAARGMDGEVVTIEAILTWQQEYQTRLEAYVQDGTAGIALFDFGVDPAPLNLMRGDMLRVRGTVSSFGGEVEITSVDVITVTGSGPVPGARAVTAAEINADMFQGELATISGTVDSVNVLSFGNQDVYLTDANGDDFLVYADSRTGVVEATWTVGMSFQVTGVLTTDTSNPSLPAQLEPRDPGDVQ